MNLEKRLLRWRDAGLIDEDARQRIQDYESKETRPWGMYAFGGLGGLAVALGILLVIGANWDGIPGSLKLLTYALMGGGLGYWALRMALLHGSARGRIHLSSTRCQATTASESGVPRPCIRLRTFTAILASVRCDSGLFARSLSPTRRL